MLKKIVITGGDGRFAQILKKDDKKLNILYPDKKELNILKNKMDLIFDDFDLIITPSAPGEALKGLEFTGSAIFNTAWSLIGNPCLTLPLFKGKNGLPIGCQLVTKVGNDNQLLSYSKQFHSLFI